ncbi:amidohydrolase/deacetylase family metallohydrolase [Spongiactinospora rosea]|uniref:Amidohydrolase/deacetylase family metallohydrolase n=1 Tax=Spongiactinospora rosea TaxID=2248750 RepID=A0A366LQ11_9ACTN|nr:amidohydrolase family protein [Spongiactinospora rosea]RBQ15730.1 amidohydrolase/deacetylase family metallohydrolase [Spongiactinospora rosea]
MTYDLVLAGGSVLDPAEGLAGRYDVGLRDGLIADIRAGLDTAGAPVFDAGGLLVVPGLVDGHAHVYPGVTPMGAWPDDICPGGGVTTVVDGGSAGTGAFPGFLRRVVAGSRTRVLCHLHLSRAGLTGEAGEAGELRPDLVDPDGVAAALREHPEVAVGIKLRLSQRFTGGPCLPMLRLGAKVAAETGRPLHVHIGATVESPAEFLPLLSAGDIVTHYQTPRPHGLLDERGVLLPAVRRARERGVLFDCGHGMTHFSFRVAEALLAQGFPPDTISSDVSARSFAELRPGLLTVMNKWLALGLTPAEVIRAATSRPAAALGLARGAGRLRVGGVADVAVLAWEEGAFAYGDAEGERRETDRRWRPVATVRAGRLHRAL